MSRRFELFSGWLEGFPRVSGDEPSEGPAYLAQVGFSPRERG